MTRPSLILAGLLLSLSAAAAAQNNAVPANVVTPAPPPREGTVGPEQLRDFALPGTRPATPPTTEAPRSAPVPAPRATPPAATNRAEPPAPASAERARPVGERTPVVREERPAASLSLPTATLPTTITPATPEPVQAPGEPLPSIAVTQSGTEASPLLPGWWPWLLVAVLAGAGLALVRRQRRRPLLAGQGQAAERVTLEPVAPASQLAPREAPSSPSPSPSPSPAFAPAPAPAPNLPAGLVTTRLRQPLAPASAAERAAAPPSVTGGVVSRRLRGWIDIDLVVREVLFSADEALLRIDLVIANSGTAAARDIAIEAVTTNGGEQQGIELERFFARPAAALAAIAELGPLNDTAISHELRMPRSAIRAYEAQGRALFVPVLAVNAAYRVASGEGRTSAAFLVGREVPGSEKLAPLLLPPGPGRLLSLGRRRLDEAIRR